MCAHATTVPPFPDNHTHTVAGPAESLLARLDEPRTAAALHDLLDNAELLAMLATMAEGLLRRSETLTGNLVASLAEVRSSSGLADLEGLRESAAQVGALLPLLSQVTPALTSLLGSGLSEPRTIDALGNLAGAVAEGLAAPASGRKPGALGLLGALKDPDTARGLDVLLGVARALGRRTTS